MASQPGPPKDELMLFTFEQEARPDGSFLVRPKKVVDDREISARAAAKIPAPLAKG